MVLMISLLWKPIKQHKKMNIIEAIATEIEPYEQSMASMEKGLIDAGFRFTPYAPTDEYNSEASKTVALASMLCLSKMLSLSSENAGGFSQSYDTKLLKERIKSIAEGAGISPDLVLKENDNNIYCVHI